MKQAEASCLRCVRVLARKIAHRPLYTTQTASFDSLQSDLSNVRSFVSIQYLHQKLWNIKVHQPHQQKREPQRTPAGKRTESPRHGQGTEFHDKIDRSKRWNASRRTTFVEWSVHNSTVLASYGHARGHTSIARQKKWHRGAPSMEDELTQISRRTLQKQAVSSFSVLIGGSFA